MFCGGPRGSLFSISFSSQYVTGRWSTKSYEMVPIFPFLFKKDKKGYHFHHFNTRYSFDNTIVKKITIVYIR